MTDDIIYVPESEYPNHFMSSPRRLGDHAVRWDNVTVFLEYSRVQDGKTILGYKTDAPPLTEPKFEVIK